MRPALVLLWAWLAGCALLAGAGFLAARLWAADPWSFAALAVVLVLLWVSRGCSQNAGDGAPFTHDRLA